MDKAAVNDFIIFLHLKKYDPATKKADDIKKNGQRLIMIPDPETQAKTVFGIIIKRNIEAFLIILSKLEIIMIN